MMEFVKLQGLGNDFVLIDRRQETPGENYAVIAQKMCDRHFGIGADGLLVVLKSGMADFRMRIFNPDGSEPEMCGNGLRCFARYLVDNKLVAEKFTVETLAGIKEVATVSEPGKPQVFRVDMGEPVLAADKIPVLAQTEPNQPLHFENVVSFPPLSGLSRPVINQPLHIDNEVFFITCVSMGNPHCVIFLPSVEDFPIELWGPRIETADIFPKKTNVEFIQIHSRSEIRMRVWERGAGVTLACGTGACASAVAGVLNGKLDRKVLVRLDGGELQIEWSEADNHIYMSGPAEKVFCGEMEIN